MEASAKVWPLLRGHGGEMVRNESGLRWYAVWELEALVNYRNPLFLEKGEHPGHNKPRNSKSHWTSKTGDCEQKMVINWKR